MKEKILLLSYAFPPVGMPDSYLSAKTIGNLEGFVADVVCADAQKANIRTDYSLENYVSERFDKVTRISPSRIASFLPKSSPVICEIPDYYVYLNRRLLKYLDTLDLKQYKAVVTWSQWHSIHLAGYAIKRKFPRLKWLTHFSDPWVDNPFARRNFITRFLNRKMEDKVMRFSDCIIFVSGETADLVMHKYPQAWKNKVRVIPHAFDPVLYPQNTDCNRSGILTFRYLGDFYGKRTPLPLIKALEIINGSAPELLKRIRVELIGTVFKGTFDFKKGFSLPENLMNFLPAVNYVASLKLMSEADVLLVIDAPAEKSIFLPSKLIDYLGANRPILGIVPPGASAELINRLGGWVVDPTTPEKIADIIKKIVTSKAKSKFPDEAVKSRYCVKEVCREFKEVILKS